MKLSFSDLLIPAIVLGAASWWGFTAWSDHTGKGAAEQARLEGDAREERALVEISRRHQATRAPTARLAEAGPVFTYQVQNALSAATGKAVIISGRLVDLEKRDGLYVLHLDEATAASLQIRYVLECEPKIAESIIARRTGINVLTAVVLIVAVEKAEFKPRATKNGDHEASPAQDEVPPFVARGRCVEVVFR